MIFWTIFDYIILIIGVAIIIYGLIICIRGKASLTLDYNWEKVKEEDIKKFTTAYGITYSLMGVVLTLLSISRFVYEGKYKGVVFAFYLVSYFIFMFATKRIRLRFTGSDR